jgi:hypothetical protein
MRVYLTVPEAMNLAMEMEHSPECDIADRLRVWYRDDAGNHWADSTCTVPYTPVEVAECSCGYFAIRNRAIQKLRAAITAAGA